eukprot:GHRR01023982.1.p1 GENE.GHRR01023982.1~~GHRR01023982.1.p1  ORF type:complete len:131 (+),score=24.56 GHRR01023982.1:60-452(+)
MAPACSQAKGLLCHRTLPLCAICSCGKEAIACEAVHLDPTPLFHVPGQVVPLQQLEEETLVWCRHILRNSPTALRILKSALNAAEDGQAGIQQLGGDATMLFYQSAEGNEGRTAYVEKRPPDFSKFPRLP